MFEYLKYLAINIKSAHGTFELVFVSWEQFQELQHVVNHQISVICVDFEIQCGFVQLEWLFFNVRPHIQQCIFIDIFKHEFEVSQDLE